MSVRTDRLNLILSVNGNEAMNRLNELRKNAADISLSMKGMTKNTDEYIAANNKLEEVNKQMLELKQTIGLTALSQKELYAEVKRLSALKSAAVPMSKEYWEFDKQLKATRERLFEVQNGVTGLSKVFLKFKNEIKQVGTLAVGYLGFQFLTNQFRSIITGAGKMSDQLADLRRVAGLTATEADRLNASLKNIDTRTANSSLREIAIIAGKLGVAKEDILDFTKAVDQLVVSLGDELGDADQITTQLGKILNVFDGKITGENITKLGNAFVELANSGAATGGFIAEFDQRLSGIAKSAGISLGALSGLGAGLEEMGARVESSSTAIQKLIININKDVPKAAEIAGKSLEEFRETLKIDPTEALLQYSQGLVRSKESFEEVVASFKDAGEEGARVIEVISKLGTGADTLRERVDLGKKSIEETTAITEAYGLKNENLGAEIDKLGKKFDRFISSSGMVSFVTTLVRGFASLINILTSIPGPLVKITLSLGALIVAMAVYNSGMIQAARLNLLNAAATLKNIVVINAKAAALVLSRVATNAAIASQAAYIVITNLLTGSIRASTAAIRLWSIAMKTGLGPISLLIVAIGAIVVGVNALGESFKTSATQAKYHSEMLAMANKDIAEQQSLVTTLTAVLKDHEIGEKTREQTLKDLIAISPEYLSGLTLENIAHKEGKRILDDYNASLQANANLKAASLIKDREFNKVVELKSIQQEIIMAQKSGKGFGDLSDGAKDAFSKLTTSVGRTAFTSDLFNLKISASDYTEALGDIQKKIDEQTKNLNTSTDNYVEQQKKKDSDRKKFLMHQIEDNAKALNQFEVGTEAFKNQQKKYQAAIDKFNAEFGNKNVTTDNKPVTIDASVSARKKELEEKLQSLKDDYDKLNATDKKGQTENLALQKKYQDELDALMGTSKKPKANKEFESLKKEAINFQKELMKLKQEADLQGKSIDEAEVIRIQNKYQELTAKALLYYQKNLTSLKQFEEQKKLLTDLQMKEVGGITAESDYKKSLDASDEYFDEMRKKVADQYGAGLIDEKTYNEELKDIQQQSYENRIKVHQQYIGFAKSAEAGLTAEQKKQYDEDLKNYIKTNEDKAKELEAEKKRQKEMSDAELVANAKLQISNARPGSNAELDAKKNLLRIETDLKMKALQEQYKISEESWKAGNALYDQLMRERMEGEAALDKEHTLKRIDNILQYVNMAADALNSLSQIFANKENKELAKDRKANEEKKANLKKQLDAKMMSQAQYQKKVDALDEEQARKEKEVRRKQAEREKAMAIFQALINTATAITKTFTEFGWPLGIPMAAAMAATGALQVAAIASAPLPEAGRGKWFQEGDKHSDPSRGIPILIERDEAVMKASAMTDSNSYTITGTPAQITSKLNSMHGGVNWASGASISMVPKFREQPRPMNPNLPRIMEQGGIVRTMPYSAKKEKEDDWKTKMLDALDNIANVTESKSSNLRATVVLSDFKKQENRYHRARKASGLG